MNSMAQQKAFSVEHCFLLVSFTLFFRKASAPQAGEDVNVYGVKPDEIVNSPRCLFS